MHFQSRNAGAVQNAAPPDERPIEGTLKPCSRLIHGIHIDGSFSPGKPDPMSTTGVNKSGARQRYPKSIVQQRRNPGPR